MTLRAISNNCANVVLDQSAFAATAIPTSALYIQVSSPMARSNDGSADPRIQRTQALLHEALGNLIREKAYDRITVAQILERAKVSRSTFYVHFRDKDDLLAAGMRALLLALPSVERHADAETAERIVAFGLPLLIHIHQHRRSAKVRVGERGRAILHEYLRRVLSDWIVQAIDADCQSRRARRSAVNPQLLARHIASTFVLVLHWWMDQGSAASPAEADKLFRTLIMPVLRSAQR